MAARIEEVEAFLAQSEAVLTEHEETAKQALATVREVEF